MTVRFRGGFAYVDGVLPDETVLILMRLRFNGSASRWGFAIYLASTGKYEDSMLPTGDFTAVPKTHSTQHAGSASVIRPPGNYPRRTNGSDH
ncbi:MULTISPECIES: hypothetical protein [unclassified Rhodococcus (in: high G+C Gram-positive bacteria)]|uniref:hypothetical protein n=1 Tax=unclassified Rhodococcus (in: high G+C Gram-positive bacteria) TaxID=192944 RepID=UPI0033965243